MSNSNNKDIKSPFINLGQIKKNTWILTSKEDGEAFVLRSQAAERDLCDALDMLEYVKESIPHKPAGKLKEVIENFLTRFKK